jgi:hypothetical protein
VDSHGRLIHSCNCSACCIYTGLERILDNSITQSVIPGLKLLGIASTARHHQSSIASQHDRAKCTDIQAVIWQAVKIFFVGQSYK